MTTCTREQSIEQLRKIRETAAMDLAVMPSHKQGTQWAWDRQKDVN